MYKEVPTIAVLKPMLKLALLPLLLLLILAQWVGIFLTTFSMILTNLLAGLFFFVALGLFLRIKKGSALCRPDVTKRPPCVVQGGLELRIGENPGVHQRKRRFWR